MRKLHDIARLHCSKLFHPLRISWHRRFLAETACLLADVNMPGMSGPELHRYLGAAGLAIPTILVTAYPDDLVRDRALKDGVACYIYKPVDDHQLQECIRFALGEKRL